MKKINCNETAARCSSFLEFCYQHNVASILKPKKSQLHSLVFVHINQKHRMQVYTSALASFFLEVTSMLQCHECMIIISVMFKFGGEKHIPQNVKLLLFKYLFKNHAVTFGEIQHVAVCLRVAVSFSGFKGALPIIFHCNTNKGQETSSHCSRGQFVCETVCH